MTQFIILGGADVLSLLNNKPVNVYIDQMPYVLCTDEYYENIRNKNTDGMDEKDGQVESKDKIKEELDICREENEEQLKKLKAEIEKLKAELDYAKFRCALSNIMDMMHHN